MSLLCCHSKAFLSLFCSCKSSDLNSRSCSSFPRRKLTTSELKFQLCFYVQCHFHLAPYVLMSLKIFPLLFFSYFLSFRFFFFDIRLPFLSACFGFTFTFFKSLQVFKKLLPLTFHLVFDLYLFMKVIKCFLRPHAVLANSLQLFMLLAIFFTSRFTFIYILARQCFHRKNVFFVVPRHDRCKGNGENRFVQNLFKTWRRKDIPRVSSSELFSYREPRKTLLKINLLLL